VHKRARPILRVAWLPGLPFRRAKWPQRPLSLCAEPALSLVCASPPRALLLRAAEDGQLVHGLCRPEMEFVEGGLPDFQRAQLCGLGFRVLDRLAIRNAQIVQDLRCRGIGVACLGASSSTSPMDLPRTNPPGLPPRKLTQTGPARAEAAAPRPCGHPARCREKPGCAYGNKKFLRILCSQPP